MSNERHLWEIDHPYYATAGCFYTPGTQWDEVHQDIDSWEDFMAGWGDADEDYNLLYRWDWKKTSPGDYEYELKEDPAYELPSDTLELFYMLQRKAKPMSVFVTVTDGDEGAVREFLRGKAAHMRNLWEPLLDTPGRGRMMARLRSWWRRNVIATDPNPQYSRLDRMDGHR